eukprot:TRINITY_DN15652_c0_g1_i2.p1 TRINITY_DN15652_c0_g1~~TRINITY_DN15652_c0_g1_i2.p1  ORF type:complete len:121 (+),score=23.20 TRINITY_DN15652_c0_g1_i2:36-365(+)
MHRNILLRCAVKKTPTAAPAAAPAPSRIMTTTRDYIDGTMVVKELGVVVGNSVLSRNVGLDVLSRMKALVGGELYPYTKLLEDAAEEATRRVMNEVFKKKKKKKKRPLL